MKKSNNKKEKIIILGSTGSIGTQTIDVLQTVGDKEIYGLSCKGNIDLLLKQVIETKAKVVCIYDENKVYDFLVKAEKKKVKVKVFTGLDGILSMIKLKEVDFVVNSLVGTIGIEPTICAIKEKKKLALANKESLVCEGKKIINLSKKYKVEIRPIDSEHSAIWQCLAGEKYDRIKKLIITCSGGPFYGMTKKQLEKVTLNDCLKHPSWNMGKKITIDCATLVNKGLEVIEAFYLFGIKADDIEVVIQRGSYIHSMVMFKDGSVKAQISLPSMKIPISYAIYKEQRPEIKEKEIDFYNLKQIPLDKPDMKTFEALSLAYKALKLGGSYPKKYCLEAEKAVNDFIDGKIKYLDIVKRIKAIFK